MDCTEHYDCDHGEVRCQCGICWKEEHQCEYAYDATGEIGGQYTPQYTGSLTANFGTTKLANDNEHKGNENIYCSETLCDTITTTPRKGTYIGRTITSHKRHRPTSTQLSICPGTFKYTGFHFPTPGSEEWAYHIHNINEYKQSEDKKRFILEHIESFKRKLDTTNNMDRPYN